MDTGHGSLVPLGLRRASELSWRLLVVAAALLAIGWALAQVFLVVVVVIAALLLTALLNPLAARLRRRGWRTGRATAVTMVSGLLVLGLLLAVVVPAVVGEFGKVGEQAAAGVREAQRWLVQGPLSLSAGQVDKIANGVADQLRGGGGTSVLSGVVSGALAVGEVIAAALLAIVLTVFFVRDGRAIFDWLVGLLPSESRPRAQQVGEIAWETLGRYIRGIALIGLFDATLIGLAILLLGVPLVLPLMLLTFVAAFVPIVGATVAGIVSALVALVDQGLSAALILVAVIVAVQQLEGHVLYPVVMRRAVDVHPVAILIGVAAGAVLAGVFGAIVAVPAVAVCGRVLALVRDDRAAAEAALVRDGGAGGERGLLLDPDGERAPRFVSAQPPPSA